MQIFVLVLDIIGTAAFALSGAMVALKKEMDIFGVCVLGITTACGGGIIRDLILGLTPPAAFRDPTYVLIAIGISLLIFCGPIRHFLFRNRQHYELGLLLTDSAGLAIFTVSGVKIALENGHSGNPLLVLFLAVLTGVGGGVVRDLFAGDRPYIFVKHVYASAALAGAVPCYLLWNLLGSNLSMSLGFAVVLALRLCAAHLHWKLPKSPLEDYEKSTPQQSPFVKF